MGKRERGERIRGGEGIVEVRVYLKNLNQRLRLLQTCFN